MDEITKRRIDLMRGAVGAEAVAASIGSLRIDTSVYLQHEDFSVPLVEELREMEDRVQRLSDDLCNLAHAVDPDPGFGDERHRLAHRGAEPSAEADREQLAAIEGGAAEAA